LQIIPGCYVRLQQAGVRDWGRVAWGRGGQGGGGGGGGGGGEQ